MIAVHAKVALGWLRLRQLKLTTIVGRRTLLRNLRWRVLLLRVLLRILLLRELPRWIWRLWVLLLGRRLSVLRLRGRVGCRAVGKILGQITIQVVLVLAPIFLLLAA